MARPEAKSAIKRNVHGFHFSSDIPTVDKILTAVNDDPELPYFKRATMYELLRNNSTN
jgi:hypothetical protein